MEDEEEDNEDALVEQLTPSLHQESKDDISSTVQLVVGLGLGSDRFRFQRSGRCHGVLSSDSDTVEELTPGVADDPAVEGCTPRSSEHDETEEHDEGVLDETKLSTDPVSFDTDRDLTDNDTDGLEVGHSRDPVLVADLVSSPASLPDRRVERTQVTDGEDTASSELLASF